jgi:predicted CXXCH cytochrome family protein
MSGRGRAAALCAAASLLLACTGPRGHRILTFLFDGVPPLEEPGAAAAGRPGAAPGGPAAVPARAHGPYAAKMCEGCHETGRGNALVVPADQLCGRCHVLDLGKKYVHGPLNAGGCLLCHDPHESKSPYLLVAESGAFCLGCHDRWSLGPTEGHEAAGPSCTFCHEAHMSDRRYLLK